MSEGKLCPPLYIFDNDEKQSVLLAYVSGTYIPPSKRSLSPAYMGIYLNDYNTGSLFSLCYFLIDKSFIGHHSPYDQKTHVSRVLLDAWYEYDVYPFDWMVVDNVNVERGTPSEFVGKCNQHLSLLKEVVSYYQAKESILPREKLMKDGPLFQRQNRVE